VFGHRIAYLGECGMARPTVAIDDERGTKLDDDGPLWRLRFRLDEKR
jgi:hypothetical protein